MSTSMWLAVLAVGALGLVAALVEGRGRSRRRPPGRADGRGPRPAPRPGPRRGGRPAPGEIWWAEVPYEDGPGSKDRPCLVLSVRARTVRVAKITTKHHEELPGVLALPEGAVDDARGRRSYLETAEIRSVPAKDFRRRAGALDADVFARIKRLTD